MYHWMNTVITFLVVIFVIAMVALFLFEEVAEEIVALVHRLRGQDDDEEDDE